MRTPDIDAVWSATAVPMQSARLWRLGPLHLLVVRLPWEWEVAWWWDGPPLEEVCALAQPVSPDHDVPPGASRRRFAFGETVDPITLTPALGDRIFVAMPDRPFFVLPDESVRAHLSLPLWVQVRLGRKRRLAVEVPVHRPQDTWFGDPTAGTLGYASRTRMRLDGDAVLRHRLRAVVSVDIVNGAQTPLQVSRLRLPVPALALLRGAEGHLETTPVRYTRQRDDLALIDIGHTAAARVMVTPPREPSTAVGSLTRAFNAFFRGIS